MRFLNVLLAILFVFASVTASARDNFRPSPAVGCVRWLSGFAPRFLFTPPQITTKVGDIHFEVRNWINWNPRTPEREIPLQSSSDGNSIQFKNAVFKKKAFLGGGAQGDVYLVESQTGKLAVMKVAEPNKDFKDIVDSHNGSKRYLPQILAIDWDRKIMLMEYWEGIPVETIEERGKELGLSEELVKSIQARFRKWQDKQAYSWWPNNPGSPFSCNAIYSFKTDDFYFIDPG